MIQQKVRMETEGLEGSKWLGETKEYRHMLLAYLRVPGDGSS